eukprot:SM000017S02867  [mRNA]  locus=s17:737108:739714:- [translate_table: standard]
MAAGGAALAQAVATTLAANAVGAGGFDFFFFVQQWPGSYCNSGRECCCNPDKGKPEAQFSIHGLWPNYADGSYPQGIGFDDDNAAFMCAPAAASCDLQVRDLESDLEDFWDTLSCPASKGESFWSHEWSKHGTCADTLSDEHAYFEAALELWNDTLVTKALADAGITPGASYNLRDITDAIEGYTGYTPAIECNKDEARRPQLYQIYICVDTDARSLIDCPVFPKVYKGVEEGMAEGEADELSLLQKIGCHTGT